MVVQSDGKTWLMQVLKVKPTWHRRCYYTL